MIRGKKEKRARADRSQSEEDEQTRTVDDTILKDIFQKLKKLDVLEEINNRLSKIENTVKEMEKGLNSMKEELEEVQSVLDQKKDKTAVEALEDELEELRNRSRRNNLVF